MYFKISPSTLIPLTYEMDEGVSSPVRYVQSKIILSSSRAVLKSVNLTDNGNGDFSDFSQTPSMLNIAEGAFFEVITTVYTDALYTSPDNVRYATTKTTFLCQTDMGGAILGGREVNMDFVNGLATKIDDIVKKIFEFNEFNKIKDKNSFAQKVLLLQDKVDLNGKDIKLQTEKMLDEFSKFEDTLNSVVVIFNTLSKNIKEIIINSLADIKKCIENRDNILLEETKNNVSNVMVACDDIMEKIKVFDNLDGIYNNLSEYKNTSEKVLTLLKNVKDNFGAFDFDLKKGLRDVFDEFDLKIKENKLLTIEDKIDKLRDELK